MSAKSNQSNNFESEIFANSLLTVELGGASETVMRGYNEEGDRLHDGLPQALSGVAKIAVLGWSSQGPAQAQNIRDSLYSAGLGSKTQVVVGLRDGSKTRAGAEEAGFNVKNGTLDTVEGAIDDADLSLMLISDAAMAKHGQEFVGLAKSGSVIGLSHGFWLGHLENMGEAPRPDVGIIGVCPKGMGPSVRKLYEQDSGINTSFAVSQGGQRETDLALGWSRMLGAPYTFQTTLENEWRSDIFGERAVLLGGVHGIVEAMYKDLTVSGAMRDVPAYLHVVESLVGPISSTISEKGLKGLYDSIPEDEKPVFRQAYRSAYGPLRELTEKIYADVSSGREIAEVIADNERDYPMFEIGGTPMWQVGAEVRMNPLTVAEVEIDTKVAGVYAAAMMAQVDVLMSKGHHMSEIVNESIIEAVDSLNPYMKKAGVAHMVDNCSVTARRGSRKWAPQYEAVMAQAVLPNIDGADNGAFDDFENHPVHGVLSELAKMRPPVAIVL